MHRDTAVCSLDARHYPSVLSICLMEYFSGDVASLLGSDEVTLIIVFAIGGAE